MMIELIFLIGYGVGVRLDHETSTLPHSSTAGQLGNFALKRTQARARNESWLPEVQYRERLEKIIRNSDGSGEDGTLKWSDPSSFSTFASPSTDSCDSENESLPGSDLDRGIANGGKGIGNYLPRGSPIILDLNGNGAVSTSIDRTSVYFDHDGDGRKTKTGWVCPNDGLLVFDRNNDGILNDGTELFGDNTLKYGGGGRCANGFEALAGEGMFWYKTKILIGCQWEAC